MGGVMSITGEPEGAPMKVGVGIADIMTGMHAAVAILAALRHRDATGQGQHIDLALLDTQVSWLCYHALEFLNTGRNPARLGNAHASVVPYEAFATRDGHVILAAGNDRQFAAFCDFAGRAALAADPRFRTNSDRIRNRAALVPAIAEIIAGRTTDEWVEGLGGAGVPCGPINTLDRVFADPQVAEREMVVDMAHPLAGPDGVKLVANPGKLSVTPLDYARPPPTLGEHTAEVLRELLDVAPAELARLAAAGAIGL
jgi:crotonobetainyl-CoA:carnitine CoA-transferase CaiB-like acyl-CoA transferase